MQNRMPTADTASGNMTAAQPASRMAWEPADESSAGGLRGVLHHLASQVSTHVSSLGVDAAGIQPVQPRPSSTGSSKGSDRILCTQST